MKSSCFEGEDYPSLSNQWVALKHTRNPERHIHTSPHYHTISHAKDSQYCAKLLTPPCTFFTPSLNTSNLLYIYLTDFSHLSPQSLTSYSSPSCSSTIQGIQFCSQTTTKHLTRTCSMLRTFDLHFDFKSNIYLAGLYQSVYSSLICSVSTCTSNEVVSDYYDSTLYGTDERRSSSPRPSMMF